MSQDPRREWLENALARWEKPILHLCYAYLGDTALAEDAVQETFFKAWKHYDRFRGEAEEKTWLMRIAMNHCRDQLRSAWFRNTDRSVPFEAKDDTVTRAVMSLPPKLKEVTLLHWYQGMSLEEVSGVLRLPRSTVNYRLKKAKTMLKGELKEWYDEE